jgi:cell division protease FtsH
MVGRWGMSAAIGPVSVLPGPGRESMFGMDPDSPSSDTRERVDAEVRRILEECYQDALDTLREHQDKLVSLSAELLRVETLDEADAYQAAGVPRPSAPSVHASAEHVGAAAETVVLAKPAPPTPPAPADPS